METTVQPTNNARALAHELNSRWFFRHTKSLVLLLIEVSCYVLALVSLVAAVLFVKVVMSIAEFANSNIVVVDGDLFPALIIVVQVLLFVFAFGLVLLGRFMRRSRKHRMLVQRLCDAVLDGK